MNKMHYKGITATESFFVNLIRVSACLLIFMCHAFTAFHQATGNAIFSMGSQIFNVGVPIFFMISGYLYANKRPPANIGKWYLKQAKKIIFPLWIFLIGLLIAQFLLKIPFKPISWIETALAVVGLTQNYISGGGSPMVYNSSVNLLFIHTCFNDEKKQSVETNDFIGCCYLSDYKIGCSIHCFSNFLYTA